MAKEFSKKLKELMSEVNIKLIKLINSKGEKSKFSNDYCLRITDDERMYNLEGGRYLVEVKTESRFDDIVTLVDNNGYTYNYTCLETPDFMEVADHLIESYSKKKRRK